MNKIWSDDAWDDYIYWQGQDKKTLRKINELIKDINRNGYSTYCRNNKAATKTDYCHLFVYPFLSSAFLINCVASLNAEGR